MTPRRTRNPSDATPDVWPYRGCVIAVGTRHGKQHQLAPAFRSVLGARLLTPPDLDTDRFGTFTGEVARRESPLDAARAKAKLAMDATGLPHGLASEASYGPLPGGWYGHEEILLFRDDLFGIDVVEGHRTASMPGGSHRVSRYGDTPASLLATLPGQALIVRPSGPAPDTAITKGITDTATLRSAIAAAAGVSPDRLAVVEPDLRAQHNPSRRVVLVGLATTLARRLATACPACAAPGFGRVDCERGLPCRICGTPTPSIGIEVHACPACAHRISQAVGGSANPAVCPACNP